MPRIALVVLLFGSTGCSLMKLTVLTGPGCCAEVGERVSAIGPHERQAIVHVSVVVEAPPAVELPPGAVVITPPPRADVRVACTIEERVARERVERQTVEYGTVERLVLGGWALAATTIAGVALWTALDDESSTTTRLVSGAGGALLLADATATAALAIFHPTELHDDTTERAGAWHAVDDGCPIDLELAAAGVSMPIAPDGSLPPMDALRIAQALEAGEPLTASTTRDRAEVAMASRTSTLGRASEGAVVLTQ